MKREAHGHTKMKRLCKILSLPIWGGVGVLESIWKLTAQESPQGDIGKLSDDDIALGIDWDREPSELVSALVEAKWLDRVDDERRLLVHDWAEHSDDSIDMKLARCGKLYADGRTPRMSKLNRNERATICQTFGWSLTSVAQKGTKRHEKPLPAPAPAPAPEPAPGPAPAPPAAENPLPPPEPVRPNVTPVAPKRDPDAGAELPLAHWLFEEINVPVDQGTRVVAADAIRKLAKEGGTMQTAAEYIAQQAIEARCRGETINRFWFTDQRYMPNTGKSRKQADKEARRKAFIEGGE
jgi:hypothetical protein